MRAPRALIPLLSVCGAAAVVAAAATGASIDGLSANGGPAHADGAAAPPAAVMVNALTWNVCGPAAPGCPAGRQVVQQAGKANAVLLQEVCEGQVDGFRKALSGWTWAFAPGGPACARGQGRSGVAIGTTAPLVQAKPAKLPGRAGIALCGEVPSWTTRVCVAQLSASDSTAWRRKQATALTTLAGTGRVLLGGDLGSGAPLTPLSKRYAVCGTPATGRLLTPRTAAVTCGAKEPDRRPLTAEIRFP